MNEHEQTQFESRLRSIRPAAPSAEFLSRLLAARPAAEGDPQAAGCPVKRPESEIRAGSRRRLGLRIAGLFRPSDFGFRPSLALRWLVPALALIVVAASIWRASRPETTRSAAGAPRPAASALTADDVQIGQELVSSFETVAKLPSGEPVRFRCRHWMDEVVVRNKEKGFVIQQRTPRVEIVPVSYETY